FQIVSAELFELQDDGLDGPLVFFGTNQRAPKLNLERFDLRFLADKIRQRASIRPRQFEQFARPDAPLSFLDGDHRSSRRVDEAGSFLLVHSNALAGLL